MIRCASDCYPSLAERQDRLGRLIGMMAANRERIAAALDSDFGSPPKGASDLLEVLGVVASAQ